MVDIEGCLAVPFCEGVKKRIVNKPSEILNKSMIQTSVIDKQNKQLKVKDKNAIALPNGSWIAFILWPFTMFVYAIKNYRKAWSSKIFLAFAAFFGFTMVQGGDTLQVTAYFDTLNLAGNGFQNIFASYFMKGSDNFDLVYQIIANLVSFFTSDVRFLFAVLTFLLGYFIIKSLRFLIQRVDTKIDYLGGLILISFVLAIEIWRIGGRWSLGAVVYSYGILQYLLSNKVKFLWLAFTSLFIHWSFFIMAPVIFIYLFLKNKTRLYYIFFVLTFFVNLININVATSSFESVSPTVLEQSKIGYMSDTYVQTVQQESEMNNWYVWGHLQMLNLFLLGVFSFVFFKKISFVKRKKQLFALFNFALLFFGIANALSVIPNMTRFFAIGEFFMLAFLILYLYEIGGYFHPALKIFGYVSLSIFIIVRIRIGFDYISAWTIIGNPLYVYFVHNTTPLITYIKMLF
jgi:hypothetical protein